LLFGSLRKRLFLCPSCPCPWPAPGALAEQRCGRLGLLVGSLQVPFPWQLRRSALSPAHQGHFKNSFLLCFSCCLLARLALGCHGQETSEEGRGMCCELRGNFTFFILFIFWAGLGHLHLASRSVPHREHQSLSCCAAQPFMCQEIIHQCLSSAAAGTWRLLAPRLPRALGAPRAGLFLPPFHLVEK